MKMKYLLIMIINCVLFSLLINLCNVYLLGNRLTSEGIFLVSSIFGAVNGVVINRWENTEE